MHATRETWVCLELQNGKDGRKAKLAFKRRRQICITGLIYFFKIEINVT